MTFQLYLTPDSRDVPYVSNCFESESWWLPTQNVIDPKNNL